MNSITGLPIDVLLFIIICELILVVYYLSEIARGRKIKDAETKTAAPKVSGGGYSRRV